MTVTGTPARLALPGPARRLRASARRLAGPGGRLAGPIAIVLALAGIVSARLLGSRAGIDPLLVGAAFGTLLAVLAFAAGARTTLTPPDRRPAPVRVPIGAGARGTVAAAALGVAVGVGMTVLAMAGPTIAGTTYVPGLGRPAAPFLPWAVITVVVASAEEGVLRGVLLDRVARLAGLAPAVVVTTAAFALMHVPLYGWHVVPLDVAIGLVLAGLRLGTGGLVAPAAAHVVADLATWWL